jgi:hypothetical protein
MSKLALLVSLLLCLTSTLWGQTDEWKAYKNIDGNFSVLFPGAPKDLLTQKAAGLESHTIVATQLPVGYSVIYVSMRKEQAVIDPAFAVFKDGVFKQMASCTVTSDGPVSQAVLGYIGHSYRMGCDSENMKVTVVANLYWGKHYAYAVMAVFSADLADPPETKKFLNSFSVIDASK